MDYNTQRKAVSAIDSFGRRHKLLLPLCLAAKLFTIIFCAIVRFFDMTLSDDKGRFLGIESGKKPRSAVIPEDTGEKKYIDKTTEIIEGWIDRNPAGTQPAWAPYATALRIVNWISYYGYVNKALDKAFSEKFLKSLHSQYKYVLDYNLQHQQHIHSSYKHDNHF